MKNIFRKIEKEYEDIRRKNSLIEEERKKEIYSKIPTIKDIDEMIRNIGILSAKEQILNPSTDNLQKANDEILRLRTEKERLLIENNYPAYYLDEIYKCKKCKDTGKLENGKKCSCMEKKLAVELYDISNISYTLERENFDTFNLGLFSEEKYKDEEMSPKENMKLILDASREFIKTFEEKNDFNLLFYGATGQGKTFMINCIAKELLNRNISVVYQTAFTICEVIEDYKFRRNSTNDIKYKQLFDAELLIIDDLGIEMATTVTNSGIFNIINKRIISGKKTIISTNLEPEELTNIYTDRVTSRVFQRFYQLKFFGEDLRLRQLRLR